MAYWTIDFITFAGNPIHIMIEKPGSVDVALTPSSNPCSIKEEGDEDLFTPVKTQSGYIEVITDSIALAEQIIPTQGATRKVLIYETLTPTSYTEPLWTGWVQPKLLTFTPWKGKQKLKIPIECKLSGLKYLPANLPSSALASIGTLLYRMLSGFDYAYFQGGMVMERNNVTDDQAKAWLRKKIYTTLFDSEAKQYDVLKNICIFFGWTCRQFGAHVFFIANRNVDAVEKSVRYIYISQLNASAFYSYAATWPEVQLADSMLCSDSNKVVFTEGCRTAKAVCSLSTFDQSADLDFTQIGLKIDNGSINPNYVHYNNAWSSGGHDYERDRAYYEVFGNVNVGDFTVEGYNVRTHLNKNDSTDANDWDVGLAVLYTSDYTTDTYWQESADPTSPGHYQTDIAIHSRYYGYLIFRSTGTISYDTAGKLTIKTELDTENYSQNSKACLFIKVGNKWFNPSTGTWDTTQPSNYITIEKNENNRYEREIPIPESMSGVLEIQFVTDKNFIEHYNEIFRAYCLKSVSVEYESEQNETYNSQISEVEVSATNNAKFSNDVSYDSIICIKGTLNANSKNFLIDPDGSVSAGLYDTPYSDAQLFSPLQRLCDETVEEMRTVGRLYELRVRWRGGITYDITPNTMIYITSLNEWAYAVGWEIDLHDDVIKLKLLRREYSEGNQ